MPLLPIFFIDDQGFHRKRLDEILLGLQDDYHAAYGDDVNIGPDTKDGQWIGTQAEAYSSIAEGAEALYNSMAIAGASGAQLARLARLTGTTKQPAQFSTVTLTLGGVAGTVVPIGQLIASDEDPTAIFQTTAAGTIPADVAARATVPGPVPGPAGHLTVLQTVISGWTSVTNALAAALGRFDDTDPALRVRQAESVALPSQGIVDGMRAALLNTPDVEQAEVYENETDVALAMHGGGSLARHAIQAVVLGGAAADIAQAMFLKKNPGCTQVGAQQQAVIDSQGRSQLMRFDRPDNTPIFVTVQLTAPVTSPTSAAIINAIVAFGLAQSVIGGDVTWSRLFIPINSVPGISVNALFVGTVPSPVTQNNVTIRFDAIATWDPANIIVTWV